MWSTLTNDVYTLTAHSPQSENDRAFKAMSNTEIEAKRLENKLSRFMKDKVVARKTVQHMLEKVSKEKVSIRQA